MKAVILSAGRGTRMLSATRDCPKSLVPVLGVTILQRLLDSLGAIGIHDVLVTTGFEANQIKKFLMDYSTHHPRVRYECVHNPQFATTNYIYSLWLAKESLSGHDVLLFHGDMVVDNCVLTSLLASQGSSVCIQSDGALPSKDFKARIIEGRIAEISVHIDGSDVRPCMPVYKLSATDFSSWMQAIDAFIAKGRVTEYAEDALNTILPSLELRPSYYDAHTLCMEVDTPDDLQRAESLIKRSM